MKKENEILRVLHYICLICVIGFGLIAIVGTGGGSGDGNGVGGTLKLMWVEDSTMVIDSAQYGEDGFLIGYMCYSYFEIKGGSGEVEITADLESKTGDTKGRQTSTFHVEEGQSYKLSSEVICSGPSDYDPGNPPPGFPNEFTISFSSPSATSPEKKTVQVQGGFYTNTLSLGQLYLDPWEYTPQQWILEAKVFPMDSGSISDSLELLVYEGVRPGRGGEYYVGGYDHGTEVMLTATPSPGYVFEKWYGTWATQGSDRDQFITFEMVVPTYMEARFVKE
ncbi:MAG: InlB B-repeat-containing protein [Candidatus Ranarchaeia archaeon]|jgi:hypothetical protein